MVKDTTSLGQSTYVNQAGTELEVASQLSIRVPAGDMQTAGGWGGGRDKRHHWSYPVVNAADCKTFMLAKVFLQV